MSLIKVIAEARKKLKDKLRDGESVDSKTLAAVRIHNNPRDEPTGHYTGRCMNCHSDDLWCDVTAYGCNFCDAMYFVGDLPPKITMNESVPTPSEVKEYNSAVQRLALDPANLLLKEFCWNSFGRITAQRYLNG